MPTQYLAAGGSGDPTSVAGRVCEIGLPSMRRAIALLPLAFVIVSFAVLAGGASAAQGLSERKARSLASTALHRQFKASWDYGNFKRLRCGTRLGVNKRRCSVSWGIGDVSYRGKVTIRYPGGQVFYYSFVIRKINQFCVAEGGSNCVKVIRR
jgi:hypothetical protein